MFRSLLFLCGFAAAVISSELDRHWDLWKKMHKKVYSRQVNVFNPCQPKHLFLSQRCLCFFCICGSDIVLLNNQI